MAKNRHLILYAEDDLDDFVFIKESFESHDHIQIIHVTNGEKALIELNKLFQNNTIPCLVILDINMPIMNGREALEEIKNKTEYKDIPVVLFSTSTNPLDRTFAEKWGAVLIPKPTHYKELDEIALKFIDKCNFEKNKLNIENK